MPTLSSPQPLLSGKSTAITGGATGIGLAIARAYLMHGARVAINHLGRPEECENVRGLVREFPPSETGSGEEGERVIEVIGDVGEVETGREIVWRVVEAWERLDVFVVNAGVCKFEEFLEITPSLLTTTISTNLTGAFLTTQAAALQMSAQDPPGGSIIGISSISALVGGSRQCHYTPTKAGILSLMQSCACALGRYGIRCNAILPGTIRTRLNEEDLSGEKGREVEGRVPLGRVGVPGDVGGPAVFLASELSAYVTGAQLLVDGGLFVNLQ